MIIECAHCEAKVDGTILNEHEYMDKIGDFIKLSLLQCPVCYSPILASEEHCQVGSGELVWSDARRLWPEPNKYIDISLPELVRISLEEAERCFKGRAYMACAVMCGRVIESICSEYKTKKKFLSGGLKELLDRNIIDSRVYDWSEALRIHRNIGAHPTKERISKKDARDLLDFANAICEYVFVLSKKFEDFMTRKNKSKKD